MSEAEERRMKRILVVDDDDNLREILSTILSKGDRAIDTAKDGIAALEKRSAPGRPVLPV